jgi:hypothetical protein
MGKPVIQVGERFGHLLVIERSFFVPASCDPGSLWVVHCDCGTEKIVSARNLSSGNTRSCGCLQRKRASMDMRLRRAMEMT